MQVLNGMNRNLAENPVIKVLIQDQTKSPKDFKLNICEDDEMYLFSLSNVEEDGDRALIRYYGLGGRILDAVKQVVTWRFGSFENVSSFLDFACGYGRFTRFLVQEMPAEKIWVSDIYANAVKFQKEYLGVNGIVSTSIPEEYAIEQKFDCILANSFFSHMPERTFATWLQNLYNLLTPGGILLFSVHGEELLPSHVPMNPSGILFSPDSESQSLDKQEYGTTYVTESFVKEMIQRISNGQALAHRIRKGICRFQDLYVVTNQAICDFSTLKFSHHPQGYVDAASFNSNGSFFLEGWAADFNPGGRIEEIQAIVKDRIVGRCQPSYKRPDVADYFKKEAVLESGWSCTLEKGTVSPQDIILIKAINDSGLEWILEIAAADSLVRYKQQEKMFAVQSKLKQTERELLTTQDELQQTQHQLTSTQGELEKTQTELSSTRGSLQQTQEELGSTQENLNAVRAELEHYKYQLLSTQTVLEQSQTRIAAMESSKFWKLRQAWFQVKRSLGLTTETE